MTDPPTITDKKEESGSKSRNKSESKLSSINDADYYNVEPTIGTETPWIVKMDNIKK